MTADEPRVRVTTNLAFGVCLILLGSVLILDRLGLVPAGEVLRFWPVGLVLFGLAMVLQSFQRADTAQSARWHGSNDLGNVFLWVVIAVIFSQGFSRGTTVRTDAGETASVVGVLGRHQQISSAPAFRAADVTAIMGRAELDLRKATVAPGQEAAIEVFTLAGGSTIRVPEGWHVDLRATPVMGHVRDRRTSSGDPAGAPRVVVRGFVMWGGLDIRP